MEINEKNNEKGLEGKISFSKIKKNLKDFAFYTIASAPLLYSCMSDSGSSKKPIIENDSKISQNMILYLDQSGDSLNLNHFYRPSLRENGYLPHIRGDAIIPDTLNKQEILKVKDGFYIFPKNAYVKGTNNIAGNLDQSGDSNNYTFSNANIKNLKKGKNLLEVIVVDNKGNSSREKIGEISKTTTDKHVCDNTPGMYYNDIPRTCRYR